MELAELCNMYVAMLRAIGLTHQNSHWLTKGKNFYGNHLLFERLYNSAIKDMDGAAEKVIGLFGDEAVDLQMQAQMIYKTLEEFSGDESLEASLAIEKKFLEFSKKFYDILKKEDKMTLGLDDFILSTASSREESVYLLQQVEKEDTQMASKIKQRMAALKAIAQVAAPGAVPAAPTQSLPPGEGPAQDKERAALARLRENLSSRFAQVLAGRMPSFNLRAQRVSANRFDNYNLAIVVPKAYAKFQKALEEAAKQVVYADPYFEGTANSVQVVLA